MKSDLNVLVPKIALAVSLMGLIYAIWSNEDELYLLVALLLIVGFVSGIFFQRRQLKVGGVTTTFKPGVDDRYNSKFYDFFIDKLTSAQRSIYITGEGFECRDREGFEFARRFVDAHLKAMSDNRTLTIDRVQTKRLISKPWAEMLQEMLIKYPEQFRLFLEPRQADLGPIVSVCVIDPEHDVENTVELMVSVNRIIRGQQSTLAGIAFFHEHDSRFADDMLKKIVDSRRSAKSRRIRAVNESEGRWLQLGGQEFFEFSPIGESPPPDQPLLYFAYGSNMDSSQMSERCPSAKKRGQGILIGHRLVFNRKGDYVEGGVASVVPDPARNVHGIVYELQTEDLKRLDDAEIKTSYHRLTKSILEEEGDFAACQTYVTFPEGAMDADQGYLERLIAAARVAGLPREYVEELETHRT